MSWWVDSAVAAYLLKQQGFDVVGGFMKNYVSETWNCTTFDDANEAISVAKFLWIELLSFDLQKEYNEKIIQYIYDGYQKWITPNPDVLCNSLIKFDVFLQKVLDLWFDFIATWHYAQISEHQNKFSLLKWVDWTKDQSYFLSWLNQFQLSKSKFPIWWILKSEVRKIAQDVWLPNAHRKDSQWLCFIGNVPIKEFLLQKFQKKIGNIVDLQWNVVWQHEGAYFYTIGQRHGLNLPFKAYVIRTDVKNNIIVVWEKMSEWLVGDKLIALGWHRINKKYDLPISVTAKIRYRQTVQKAKLLAFDQTSLEVVFEEEQWAIAPGQVVVAYIGDECIGSWIIQ